MYEDYLVFDYKSAAKDMQIPFETVLRLEKEVQNEFPDDPMLMELHVLRALMSYAAKNDKSKK
ncbi:MAG: hypothetical protein LBQ01_01630 [Prevotellaceae bacterium]|jgi:hypothetical protein|nr:hypothetical protein [Prevotellaceae bacterium]